MQPEVDKGGVKAIITSTIKNNNFFISSATANPLRAGFSIANLIDNYLKSHFSVAS